MQRNDLEVTNNSLYHLLKQMDKESEIEIDFFVNDNWRFSSEHLGLYKVEECLNFLPDDLIISACDLVSDEGKTRVKVFI